MKIYIPIGFPGCGKSTWAANMAKKDYRIVIINRDKIYEMIHGTYRYDSEKSAMVSAWIDEMIVSANGCGFDVIIDECHNTIRRRARYHNMHIGDIVYVPMYTGFENAKFLSNEDKSALINKLVDFRMNDARGKTRGKWYEVIEHMIDEFEEPMSSEGRYELIMPNAEFKEKLF